MTGAQPTWRALSAALVLGVALAGCDTGEPPQYQLSEIRGKIPDLRFRLEDARGQVRTAEDFRGDAVLLFFGYTHCPDVCPMTLSRIRRAVGRLARERSERVSVLFVAVDPPRDTPEAIRAYVGGFHLPGLVGLRGKGPGFRALRERYHIHVKRHRAGPEDRDYAVDHSGQVFIFGPEGRARLLARLSGPGSDSVDALASDLRKLLEAHPG